MKRAVVVMLAIVACKSEGQPATVVIAPTPTSSASQSAASGTLLPPPTASTGADDACHADADCTWGEISHEINEPKDCMCLLGCPSLPQNKTTESRRSAAHMRLCKPGIDGQGNHCPIDDCARPPPIYCVSGKCTGHK